MNERFEAWWAKRDAFINENVNKGAAEEIWQAALFDLENRGPVAWLGHWPHGLMSTMDKAEADKWNEYGDVLITPLYSTER